MDICLGYLWKHGEKEAHVNNNRVHMFFAKFQGFDDEVTLQFAKGFDGKVIRTGDLIMAVNKKTISRVTILFLEGEK